MYPLSIRGASGAGVSPPLTSSSPPTSAPIHTPTLATQSLLFPPLDPTAHRPQLALRSKDPPLPPHTQGFALGNKDAISALESVKAPIDFNQYLGVTGGGERAVRLIHILIYMRGEGGGWLSRWSGGGLMSSIRGGCFPGPASKCLSLGVWKVDVDIGVEMPLSLLPLPLQASSAWASRAWACRVSAFAAMPPYGSAGRR